MDSKAAFPSNQAACVNVFIYIYKQYRYDIQGNLLFKDTIKYISMSFKPNFLYIVIVLVSINSILSIIFKHILLIIFCNDDRDQML